MGQMKAKQLFEEADKKWIGYDISSTLPALRGLNEGAMQDVLNINGNRYYQWSVSLVDLIKPKQIVELGGAMGVWDLMILNGPEQDFQLYSITLPENGLEFLYVLDKYSNFHPIVGNDLDMDNWKDVDLNKTDLWFFDSEHTAIQLEAELAMYRQFFKKGAILLFDDIRHSELWPIWRELPYDKYECTNPLHYSGFGVAVI